MGCVEQHGHFAKNRTALRNHIDLKLSLQDFDLSVDQDVKRACLFALSEQNCAWFKCANGNCLAPINDGGHGKTFALIAGPQFR